MSRETMFVRVAEPLIQKLLRLLPEVAHDSAANDAFVDTADTLAALGGDLMRPTRPSPYVDVMIPRTEVVEHAFEEVDS